MPSVDFPVCKALPTKILGRSAIDWMYIGDRLSMDGEWFPERALHDAPFPVTGEHIVPGSHV